MTAIYLNDWAKDGQTQMLSDFNITEEVLNGVEVLIASYTYENYSGSAFVLFRKDGKLFEVNGSHCSCHGLAEQDYCGNGGTQWDPEETTVEALQNRLQAQHYCFEGCASQLKQLLDMLT